MTRSGWRAVGGLLALGLGSVVLLLRGQGAAPRAPDATRPGAPQAPLASPATTAAPASVEGPALDAALEGFLGAVPVQPLAPTAGLLEEALQEARRSADPNAALVYRGALERLLRERPDAPRVAARRLLEGEELPEALLFQHALALSARLDDPATAALLEGLPRAGPRARAQALFALRGRRDEPRVQEALLERYGQDPAPAVRARAGFVLGEGGPGLDPGRLERARQVARADLRGEDPQLQAAAADVLGVPPLGEGDRRLLTDTLERDPDPRRREAALRALASAGVSPRELLPLLQRVAAEPGASEALRQAARAALDPPRDE